jgi:hypothetical protein
MLQELSLFKLKINSETINPSDIWLTIGSYTEHRKLRKYINAVSEIRARDRSIGVVLVLATLIRPTALNGSHIVGTKSAGYLL